MRQIIRGSASARNKRLDEIDATITQAKADLESILEDEQGAFDAMPESLQQGERGEKTQEGLDSLQEAIDACETVIDSITAAKGN